MRIPKPLLILPAVLLILAATSVSLMTRKPSEPSAELLFEHIVISPVPESVKDIRASCPLDKGGRGWTEHTYILRFDISKEDLSRIIAVGNLVEWKVTYCDFCLDYTAEGIGAGVELYTTNRDMPDWFDLRQWKGFTAYYAGTERPVDMCVEAHLLLYNEQLRRAYFVDHEAVGEGPRWWLLPFRR